VSNTNTVTAIFGGTGRGAIPTLTLAATTETAFSVNTDSGTSVAVLSVPVGNSGNTMVGSGAPVEFNLSPAITSQSYGRKVKVGTEAPFFSATTFDAGRPFKIRIAGTATVATQAGNTVAINIYQGTSATLASDVKIAALTAGGTSGQTHPFLLEAVVQWDSAGQVLGGFFSGVNQNSVTAVTALSNAATAASPTALTFVASAVFASAVGGSVSVSEFSVDQL